MKQDQYRKTKDEIGKVGFALAVQWGRGHSVPETVADALRLMETRKDGKRYKTKKAQREAAETLRDVAAMVYRRRRLAQSIRQGRSKKAHSRPWSYGNCGTRAAVLGSEKIPQLPTGTLRKRAQKRIIKTVRSWMEQNCPDYSGETLHLVFFADTDSACGVEWKNRVSARTQTERGEQYSRKCTYSKTDATHAVTVPADYWSKVIRRGMVEVDGLLTLDLDPITHDSRTVYAAKWARVAGKRLKMETGYIAVDGDQTAHAKTPAGACAILTRRENEARFSRLSRKIRERLESMRLNGYGEMRVTLSDSYRAGNCKPGTLHFRDSHFPGRDSATVEEVLRVDSQRGLAINACLQAIRRQSGS